MAYTADQINTIYQNVLFRPAEPAAIAFYANSTMTDAQVRQAIELSQEAQQFTTPVIRLFQAALGRLPTANDLKFYVTEYKYQGISLDAIASQFANSTEYANRAGGTTVTSTFIQTLYQDVLGRSASASEVAFYTGKSAAAVITAISFSPEATQFNAAATVTFLDSAAQGNPNTGTLQSQNGINVGTSFTLTQGTDSFVGTGGNDTFNATNLTLTGLDTINGGAGNDALNINSTQTFTQPNGLNISNVETVNLQVVGGATISTASGSGFTGVTQLTVVGTPDAGNNGAISATADATTNVTVTNTAAGANATTVAGGKNVAVTVTGATAAGAAITVGSATAPATGTVTVNNSVTNSTGAALTGNGINVTGGTVLNINSVVGTGATGTGNATTIGNIAVTGTASTTSVTVSQTAAATGANAVNNVANTSTARAAVAGVVNGTVQITDGNFANVAAGGANTISAVALSSYASGSFVRSSALNTLNLSGTGGTLTITAGGTAAQQTANATLNLGLGGGTLGAITDSTNGGAGQYTTVNAALTANTTLGGFVDPALRTLALSGTGVLTLGNNFNNAVTSLTQTGAAGLNANVSGAAGLTAINASGTTGAQTLTINAANQSFTGGAGRDVITIGQSPTKAITGGSGSTDQIVLTANGSTYTAANFAANVTGFEQLGINNSTDATSSYNLANLGGSAIKLIEVYAAGGTSTTFTNVTAGTALQLDAATTSIVYQTSDTNGAAGSVSVNLAGTTATGGTAGFTTGSLTLTDANGTGIGNVSINSDASVFQGLHTITTLVDPNLSNLAITGTGSLSITNATTASTSLTISDNGTGTSATADGIVNLTATNNALGNISYSGSHAFTIGTLNDSVANLTISNANTGTTGVLTVGAHTDNALTSLTLNGSVAYTGTSTNAAAITVNGGSDNAAVSLNFTGAGVKTITLGNGNNTVVTGAGNDVITLGTGANTVTGAAGADTITFGTHTGVDKIIQTAAGDSGAFSNAAATISTTAFDVVSGLKAGDQVQLAQYAGTLGATTAVNAVTAVTATNNADFLVRGTYNASTKTFVGSSTGADSLYVYDGDATAGVAQEAVVLVGYAGTQTTHAAAGLTTLA